MDVAITSRWLCSIVRMRKELINVKISKGFELEMISRKPKKWYNLRMKRSAEVFAMKDFDGRSVSDLSFLYKVCKPLPENRLYTWMRAPEFTKRIREARENSIEIDKVFVLDTMKDLARIDFERYGESSKFANRDFYRAVRVLERIVEQEFLSTLDHLPDRSTES